MKYLLCLLLAGGSTALADPLLTSWSTARSSTYARVYETTTAQSKGTTVTNWGSGNTTQSSPAYADIQEISFSANWVYVKYTGLASYIMGPWLNPQGGQFMFWPTNRKAIRKFPRSPSAKTGTKSATASGVSGLWVNGTAIFNSLDGDAWNGSGYDGQALVTDTTYFWFRNAPVAEAFNFDAGNGHQPPTAIYHTHQDPLGLRYQVGDHVSYNTSTKLYTESTTAVIAHSPILGWANDGYPVYGPYGYSSANVSTSGVRRMVSGYSKRDGTNGTDTVANNPSIIPAWFARFRQGLGQTYSTTATTARPSVNSTYPLGTFAQDYDYLGDNGKTLGVDFDLDEYNGRTCVTPEYPGGTYAYFVDIDSSGNSVYPFTLGFNFYGNATGASVTSITETVTSYFKGNVNLTKIMSPPAVDTGTGNVTLTWSSVEGGAYLFEGSDDLQTWSTINSAVSAAKNSTTTSTVESAAANSNPKRYYRVTRSSVASYDSF